MRAQLRASLAAVAVLAAAAGMSVGGGGAASAAAAAPGGTWGSVQDLPGIVPLLWNGSGYNSSSVSDFGCSAPGNCVAVGDYGSPDTGATVPFVATEANGTWGTQPLAGLPAEDVPTDAHLTEVSCGQPDFCTAVGTFGGRDDPLHVFAVTETGGTWGTPAVLDGTALGNVQSFVVSGLSCPAAGECTLIGSYTLYGAIPAPFTADESGGNWGALQPFSVASLQPAAVPGVTMSGVTGGLTALSCGAPGDCTAGGTYWYGSSQYGVVQQPFIVSEAGHSWGAPQPIPGIASVSPAGPGNDGNQNEVTSVSCPDAGDCVVVGDLYPQFNSPGVLFTLDEAGGTWGQAQALSTPRPVAAQAPYGPVSCRSAGDCVIAATVSEAGGQSEVVTASESSSGAWGAATDIPGIATGDGGDVVDLTCVPSGDCTAFGTSHPGGSNPGQVYAATEPDGGAMGTAQQVGSLGGAGRLNLGVACPQNGQCTAAYDAPGDWGIAPQLATEGAPAAPAAQAPTVALAAPTLHYGSEQPSYLTVTVSAAEGGTPLGFVNVTGFGNTPICVIRLSGGTGTCPITEGEFPFGTSTLTAAYSGDPEHLPATGTATVTLAKDATVTRLAFTPGSITFAGAGTTLTVRGTVSSAVGTPSGSATVLVDGRAVSGCINVGFTGTVSCKGTTGVLAAGKHLVSLTYPGEAGFLPSTSASLPLTVSKRGTATTLGLTRASVIYRHESTERFTVSVSRAGSVYPTGKVAVRIGTTTICTITLSKGTGGCVLANTRLRAGRYTLAALYSGDGNYAPSWSAKKSLKVAA